LDSRANKTAKIVVGLSFPSLGIWVETGLLTVIVEKLSCEDGPGNCCCYSDKHPTFGQEVAKDEFGSCVNLD